MTRLLDLLGTHWFALVLLLVAAGLGAVAAIRNRAWAAYAAVPLAAFALGDLFLHGWKYQPTIESAIYSVPLWGLYAGVALLVGAVLVLVLFRVWSFWFAVVAACAVMAAAGALGGRWVGSGFVEIGKSVTWIRFVSPWWLLTLLFVPAVYLISRKSLSGLGPVRRWVAITARMLVVACLALALAEPRVRRPSENMTVIFVVDRSASVPRELVDETGTGVKDRRWGRVQEVIESSVSVYVRAMPRFASTGSSWSNRAFGWWCPLSPR